MSSVENLLEKYPEAEVIESIIKIDEANFQAQRNKILQRNSEGASIGVVWMDMASIVLARRLGLHPGWALPGGTVERNEDFDAAFLREIYEETSVKALIDRLLLLDRRLFVSPTGDTQALNLAVFEATAIPKQTAITTDDAHREGLEVQTFVTNALPEIMIFKDKQRTEMIINGRS